MFLLVLSWTLKLNCFFLPYNNAMRNPIILLNFISRSIEYITFMTYPNRTFVVFSIFFLDFICVCKCSMRNK